MKLQIDSKDQIKELKADGRGRITIGSEYADQEVQIAILETEPDDGEAE